MQHEAGELVREALWSATARAADGRAAVLAWIEEFLSIGWDTRRLREGRTFLAPEVGLVAGVATAMEDIHAGHRAMRGSPSTAPSPTGQCPRPRRSGMLSRFTPSCSVAWRCVPADD